MELEACPTVWRRSVSYRSGLCASADMATLASSRSASHKTVWLLCTPSGHR
jgi:hypothetical protein